MCGQIIFKGYQNSNHMKEIVCFDRTGYKKNLVESIRQNIESKIIFIECSNCINQYLFSRIEIENVWNKLYVSRIEQPFDLLDILKSVHLNKYFKECDTILIAPYDQLLADVKDKEYLIQKINLILLRLESRYKKQIIKFTIKKWDTQYHLNDKLSTQN